MHKINLLYVITELELGGAQKQLLIEEALSITSLTLRRSRFLKCPINPLRESLGFDFTVDNMIKSSENIYSELIKRSGQYVN